MELEPIGCRDEVWKSAKVLDTKQREGELDSVINVRWQKSSKCACIAAEWSRIASPQNADKFYNLAINSSDSASGYLLLFADYIRIYRWAGRPLYAKANDLYLLGMEKETSCDSLTSDWLEKGLLSLWQENGIRIFPFLSTKSNPQAVRRRPKLFISSSIRMYSHTTDFGESDDARDFTSEATFAASKDRIGKELGKSTLQKIARSKDQVESKTTARLSFMHLPVINISYRMKNIENGQISNFWNPTNFSEIKLKEMAFGIEQNRAINTLFDLNFHTQYSRLWRWGILEFNQDTIEDVHQIVGGIGLARFIKANKILFDGTIVYQYMPQNVLYENGRYRIISAGRLSYQINTPFRLALPTLNGFLKRQYNTCGINIYSGYMYDKENYGSDDVIKQDIYMGIRANGLGRFDIWVQPTYLSVDKPGKRKEKHAHYRTNAGLVFRIVDEEKSPGKFPGFLGYHPMSLDITAPIRHDYFFDGPDYFENIRCGGGFDIKGHIAWLRDAVLFTSIRYEFQRFYNIDKNLHLYNVFLSIGW